MARLLGLLGIRRRAFHVDAGAPVHVRVTVEEAGTGAPVSAVDILIGRRDDGDKASPRPVLAGRTNSTGRLDSTVLVRWSSLAPSLASEPPAPPFNTVVRKTGYHEERIPFDLDQLPEVKGVKQLDLARRSIVRN